jgi:hypothetical protein
MCGWSVIAHLDPCIEIKAVLKLAGHHELNKTVTRFKMNQFLFSDSVLIISWPIHSYQSTFCLNHWTNIVKLKTQLNIQAVIIKEKGQTHD